MYTSQKYDVSTLKILCKKKMSKKNIVCNS